jgi:Ca2+-transporting ATPase
MGQSITSVSEGARPWHTREVAEVAAALAVTPDRGLDEGQVTERRTRFGPNRLREAEREPTWRALLRPFQDLLVVVLLIAAAVSAVVSREWETPVVILVVVVFNAMINFVQERKAEASLQALRHMTVARARVLRGGAVQEIPAEELVPGDVVLVEAGDSVPADGRLAEAVALEVQEAALTGESQPVAKDVEVVGDPEAALADRTDMVFMNTLVTRGRGTLVVTATAMDTQMGAIAGLLEAAKAERTPLQRQIDQLAATLTAVAGVVVLIVFALGLLRGQPFTQLFLTAVSLAVATIPEGLPAVVAFTLAMGATRLARRGAIIKRLAAVETLGSTSHICTDKTGTLTLNEMTVRVLHAAGRTFTVSGQGYATSGQIRSTDGDPVPPLHDALVAMALSGDAVLHDGELVGDPTEGALVVLAEKGGIDAAACRRARPRIAEVPFDAAYKLMATFHRWTTSDGREVIRCFVKGAPDMLAARSTRALGADQLVPFDPALRGRYDRAVADLGTQGLRTMAVAGRDYDPDGFDPAADLLGSLQELTLLALVGIVDPPRAEAKEAIAACAGAGITVHMITGDHVGTATAIADELGIQGRAASGNQLETMPAEELERHAQELAVLARVAPEHKIRFVRALQRRGHVVAMTGDGVNDAPALKQADIGVAMGITGTDVSKEAATMILTDDNFATIVAAVQEGRGIYANILKFLKFQLTTAFGFVLVFLAAAVGNIAGGAPFTAVQVLLVNLIMDGPPALSLGVDPARPDVMHHPPRRRGERLLGRARLLRVLYLGAVMATGTVAVLLFAPGPPPAAGEATTAGTLAFTTFVFFQIFNLLNVRSLTGSVFSRETLANTRAFVAVGAVLLLQILVVNLPALQGFFTTTGLTWDEWLAAAAVGSAVLWAEELRKAVVRRRLRAGAER